LGPELTARLTFEITESLYLGDAEGAGDLFDALRALGITLSIDDFGTGYSSLAYLKRFPVDNLKIDRAFVRDIASDPGDAALCRAIISMAHLLDMSVVAEGVETEEQLATLEAQGCDLVQGFLLGRPGPVDALERLLAADAMPSSAASR
jgi:EAL domain-containing protein (putative c-di-GMP-specific phosphodiesterase class I)